MTTIHSYTATQKTVDGPFAQGLEGWTHRSHQHHSKHHRRRESVGLVCPEVKGKLTGMAFRVPTPTVYVVDLTVKTTKATSYKEICAAMKTASETYLKGILGYTEDEVVSTDFIHDIRSSIFDAGAALAKATNTPRICVTRAAEGAALWESGNLVCAPAPKVVIKDTVGAGDSFMAGLMVGLTRGTDTQKVLENACRVGAFVASHNGAVPLLPPEIVQEFKSA
jgi:Glyceraldehyde 3-phosphate dehydrogenase, C-terminal domain/pfkB family carbohydrate kinase